MVDIPLFTGFRTCQVVVWDFWTINCSVGFCHQNCEAMQVEGPANAWRKNPRSSSVKNISSTKVHSFSCAKFLGILGSLVRRLCCRYGLRIYSCDFTAFLEKTNWDQKVRKLKVRKISCANIVFLKVRVTTSYCWWFRNPAPSGMYKTLYINGIFIY